MDANLDLRQLAVKSSDQVERAYAQLLQLIGPMIAACKSQQEVLGVIQALFRLATATASLQMGTRCDPLIRTEDDVAALAVAHWRCSNALTATLANTLEENEELQEHLQTAAKMGDCKAPTSSDESLSSSQPTDPPESKRAPTSTTKFEGLNALTLMDKINSEGGDA